MLVEERIAGRLVLNQPAGHVEPGETLVAAVIREVLEETASGFIPEAIIGVYTWDREATAGMPICASRSPGHCTAARPRPQAGRRHRTGPLAAAGRTCWHAAADLRSPMVLRAIDDFDQGIRQPLGLVSGPWLSSPDCERAVPL